MEFTYFVKREYQGVLEVEDESNFAIECLNDDYNFYYLVVNTVMGQCQILEYGPMIVDSNTLCNNVICKYTCMEWDDIKVPNLIDKFLNDGKKKITQATIIPKVEALHKCINILKYVEDNLNERDN